MSIQLGPIVFEEFATSGWVYSELVDWTGQVDNKVSLDERPRGHGAFASPRAFRASRAISWSAVFLGEHPADVEDAVDELAAVGAEGPVLMTVTDARGIATWRWVTVETSKPEEDFDGLEVQVAIDVVAADPRRYADGLWVETGPPADGEGVVWPLTWPLVWPGGGSSGRIVLANSGRAPSAPTFRLNGGFDSALITCVETGERIGFDRPVPSGSQVVIDVAAKSAVIDGQSDVSRWLRYREWGDVPASTSRSFQFDVTGPVGSPTLEGRVNSAWW